MLAQGLQLLLLLEGLGYLVLIYLLDLLLAVVLADGASLLVLHLVEGVVIKFRCVLFKHMLALVELFLHFLSLEHVKGEVFL